MFKRILIFVSLLISQTSFAQLDSINGIGYNEYVSDFKRYAALFKKGIIQAEEQGAYEIQADLYLKYNIVTYLSGDYEESTTALLRAIEIHENQTKNSKGLGKCLSLLGFQLKNQDLNRGLEYMQKAIQIQELEKDSLELMSTYDNFGVLLEMSGRQDSALIYYENALDLKKRKQDSVGIPFSLNKIAQVYRLKKDFTRALKLVDASTEIREKLANNYYLAENYNLYAEIYRDWGKPKLSIENFQKAFALAKTSNYPYILRNVSRELYHLYWSINSFDRAKIYNDLFTAYSDSVETLEQGKNTEALLLKYETEKKEKQIAQQQVRISETELQSKNRLLIILSLLTLSFVLTVAAYILVKRLKMRKQRSEIELAAKLQEERMRLSRDLHDHLGAELAVITGELQSASKKVGSESIQLELKKVGSYAQQAMQVLRESIWAMNADAINMEEFILRFRRFTQKFAEAYNCSATFKVDPAVNPILLNPTIVINLFRLCQEGVANACKHGQASHIKTEISLENGEVQLRISDDGIGFDSSKKQGGNGISNMALRAKEISAFFQIQSAPRKGTLIKIHFKP